MTVCWPVDVYKRQVVNFLFQLDTENIFAVRIHYGVFLYGGGVYRGIFNLFFAFSDFSRETDVYKRQEQTMPQRSAQLVFCDLSTPKAGVFNVYDDMKAKLIERGIPETEIAFIHEAKMCIRDRPQTAR